LPKRRVSGELETRLVPIAIPVPHREIREELNT